MPIFVINLERSPDRLVAFKTRLSKFNIGFERVAAVDATDISEDVAARLFSKRSGYLPLGPGEMACFLRHRKVWSLIVERAIPWAFVAEDDLHVAQVDDFFCNHGLDPG